MQTQHASAAADTKAAALTWRPLSPALGAEIIGVDLRRENDERVFAQIREIWHQSLVILLRDQELSEDDEVRFAEKFGPPAKIHTPQFVRGHPAVMLISNIREDGKPIGALPDGEMHFHTDQCHQERPAMASMLYAIEVPSEGGNTLFANGYKAYETLPAEIKRRIDGRRALNAYDYDNAATMRGTRVADGVPSYVHPVVRTHPATGRKALYVNRLMTVHIEGLPQEESDELLELPVRPPGAAPIRLRARLASRRSADVGQSLRAARAHRFQRRRAPPDAARHHPGRKAGVRSCTRRKLGVLPPPLWALWGRVGEGGRRLSARECVRRVLTPGAEAPNALPTSGGGEYTELATRLAAKSLRRTVAASSVSKHRRPRRDRP